MNHPKESPFQKATRELEERGIFPDRPPGLEMTRQGLQALGYTDSEIQNRIKDLRRIIVVAGTNGKGSTCATLETLLRSADQSVGMFTSPHLKHYGERIRTDGENLSESEFADIYFSISEKTQALRLTHFEMLTLMAFEKFLRAQVDWMIFEVGLGGTWDSTNAIPHQSCVITQLGMDHEHLLGGTLSEIAKNKFGIVRQNSTVIHQPLPEEVKPLAKEIRNQTNSHWSEAPAFSFESSGEKTTLHSRWGDALVHLAGHRGAMNVNLALQVFEHLGFAPKEHLSCLEHVPWRGRMERLHTQHLPGLRVYLSGDHNPQGIESLLEILPHHSWERIHVVFGCGKEKNLSKMLNPLYGFLQNRRGHLYLTQTPFRGLPLQEYGAWLEKAEISDPNPMRLLKLIQDRAHPKDLILVTGSIYLIGHLYTELE